MRKVWFRRSWIAMVAIVFMIAFPGCRSEESGPAMIAEPAVLPSVDGDDPAAVNAQAGSDTVTDAQATAFADQWLAAVAREDVASVVALVDWDSIMERVLRGFDVDERFRQDFIRQSTSPESILDLIGTIAAETNAGGSYRLVHATRRQGQTHITLRLVNTAGALNYHDLRLTRKADGVVADQLFFASTGQSFSDTLRSVVGGMVQSQASLWSRMTGQRRREVDALQQQVAMATAVRQGERERALALFASMPTSLQQSKMPLMLRIMATPIEAEADYLQAIDEFVSRYPDDNSLGLVTLDAAVFRQDHQLLMMSHRQLQRFTGGDPYLDLMVGGVLAKQEQVQEAKRLTDAIDPATVQLAQAHDFKLSVAMAAKDHAETLKQLLVLRDDYGYPLADLGELSGFDDFIRSPEHQAWLTSAK